MGRRSRSRGLRRWSPSPFLLGSFAGAIALVVLLSQADWGPLARPERGSDAAPGAAASATGAGPAGSAGAAGVAMPPADPLAALSEVLAGRAEWDRRGTQGGARWEGRIDGGTSLVRWNAETTAAVEEAGLEVLSGREELVERKGRWPLQRLTLEIGAAGRRCALVVVETARDPSLPAAF